MEIIIGNSFSQIIGLTTSQFSSLKKLLSYSPDAKSAYFTGGFSHTKYLIDSKGYFPTGLLTTVQEYFRANTLTANLIDIRVIPQKVLDFPKIKLGGIKPYLAQEHAAGMAENYGRGIISMPTGTGKSLVIALTIARLKVKTLVIVPSLEIKYQLETSLKALFGSLKYITVENIDSSNLKNAKDFGLLIIDEAHHSAAKTYRQLNKTSWTNIYYRIFTTATPFRNQDEEQLLFESIAGQVIYKLDYKTAIENKYIVPVEAYYFELEKQKVEGYNWSSVYSEIVVNNKSRNQLIADTLLQLESTGVSTLCLVKEIAHGKALAKLTDIPFINGADEESRKYLNKFNSEKIKSLIGTVGILGEGIDTKPAEYIIVAGLGKAKSSFMQNVGRGVRNFKNKLSCKVILFKDKSHKWSLSHFNAQKKILLDEYGIDVVKLD